MINIRDIRRRLRFVAAVLVVANAVAAGLLIYFGALSGKSRQAEFESLHAQVQRQKGIVVPPETVQQRVEEARKQIDEFYRSRLPAQFSSVYDELGRVATQNRVRLANIGYAEKESAGPGLRRIEIQATLSGDYTHVLKFINALERDRMFFIVNSVSLGEQQSGGVRLEISLETYLRSTAAA